MRQFLKSLSYGAIDRGIKLPTPQALSSFLQLSRTIELIRQQNVSVVLDVGGNRGWYAYHLRRAGFKGQMISFEPIPRDRAHIEQLCANDKLWTSQCMALGEEDCKKSFNLVLAGDGQDEQSVLSSFLEPKEVLGNSSSKIEVDMRRLDSVLPELLPNLASERIFLKMDTQGYDLSVLAGAKAVLDRIVLLQSEISVEPLYVGMPPYTESLAGFHAAGFQLSDLFVVHRTGEGTILEYDCLMQRSAT